MPWAPPNPPTSGPRGRAPSSGRRTTSRLFAGGMWLAFRRWFSFSAKPLFRNSRLIPRFVGLLLLSGFDLSLQQGSMMMAGLIELLLSLRAKGRRELKEGRDIMMSPGTYIMREWL
uniref:Uncharacterized protein n=1 Tax=Opuntia streptacantha TaxID=393608 RepID=A0A7C9AED7_OPUST